MLEEQELANTTSLARIFRTSAGMGGERFKCIKIKYGGTNAQDPNENIFLYFPLIHGCIFLVERKIGRKTGQLTCIAKLSSSSVPVQSNLN